MSKGKKPRASMALLGLLLDQDVGREYWWESRLFQVQCVLIDACCMPHMGDSSEQGHGDTRLMGIGLTCFRNAGDPGPAGPIPIGETQTQSAPLPSSPSWAVGAARSPVKPCWVGGTVSGLPTWHWDGGA